MKKIQILFLCILLTSNILSQRITSTNSNDQTNSKLWDKASVNIFSSYMSYEIKKLFGNDTFDSRYVNSWVETIVDKAQVKLKSMNKPNYKYITDVIILHRGSGYKKNTAFWWQPKTDLTITVKVDTDSLHCLLVAYCVKV